MHYLKPFPGRISDRSEGKISGGDRERLAVSAAEAQRDPRNQTYERVKRNLLLTLLELEKEFPGGICIGAGRCILVQEMRASRRAKACRYPQLRRYSITAFGFDFSRMVKDNLGMELLWSSNGVPEYDVAVSGLFYT